jgi:hypothetical protein
MKFGIFRFTVTGKGRFPYDMLRYDECYPAPGADAEQLHPVHSGVRSIQLQTLQPTLQWEPTVARWRSFGWSVVPTLTGYENEPVSFSERVTP